MRADFNDIADYDQVGLALRTLVCEGSVMKIGYELYVRARENRITGKLMADNPAGADGVMIKVMEKLGIEYQLDKLSSMNMVGESTQIPANIKILPKNPRFKRKIIVVNQRVNIA